MNAPIKIISPHKYVHEHCTVAVLSDLHKYSDISNFSDGSENNDSKNLWKRRQEIYGAFKDADHVVLNGDIFDIQCTENQPKKIDEAIEWLKKRMDKAPNTHFHFVLGNHESYTVFIKALEKLEQKRDHFHFHEHYFQLNDSLFVHGDEYLGVNKEWIANNPQNSILAEEQHLSKKHSEVEDISEGKRRRKLAPLGNLARRLYVEFSNAFHYTNNSLKGLPRIVSTLYKNIQASKLPGLDSAFNESQHIFSGHTHDPYMVHHCDKYFYNTGAAVKSDFLGFCPLVIKMDEGRTQKVQPLLKKHREKFQQREKIKMDIERATKYLVLSDLHIGAGTVSHYDRSPEFRACIDKAIDDADVIVLNGDNFELSYTQKKKIDTVMQDAKRWLTELIEKHPTKQIHFVMGNHEALDEFVNFVKQCANNPHIPHFHFHEHAFQTVDGKTVFLHGDEVMSGEYKERPIYNKKTTKPYALIHAADTHGERVVMPFVHRLRAPENTVDKIIKALKRVPAIKQPKMIENVFFGHTHVPFIDFHENGKWVTNTGSARNHSGFAAVTFYMDENGDITKPRVINHTADTGIVPMSAF